MTIVQLVSFGIMLAAPLLRRYEMASCALEVGASAILALALALHPTVIVIRLKFFWLW